MRLYDGRLYDDKLYDDRLMPAPRDYRKFGFEGQVVAKTWMEHHRSSL